MLHQTDDKYNKEFRKYLLLTKQNVLLRRLIVNHLKSIPFQESEREKWLRSIISTVQMVFSMDEGIFAPDDSDYPFPEYWENE